MELKKINGVVLEKYVEVYEGITGDNIWYRGRLVKLREQ
jgi:hypothetical protein